MKKILVIGATSAIAEEFCRQFIGVGNNSYLLARRMKPLECTRDDLIIRGANKVGIKQFDITNTENHEKLILEADAFLNGIDVLLVAHGMLPNQVKCEEAYADAFEQINTNLLSVISLMIYAGNYFENKKNGTIVIISSVAGDRGRKSNYMYGTSKGALTIFAQGLRNRLYGAGVNVITIKPGFVDTPMTKDIKKGFLWASPKDIAKGIVLAIEKKKDVVYLPGYWFYIMSIIKIIPEFVFKRLNL